MRGPEGLGAPIGSAAWWTMSLTWKCVCCAIERVLAALVSVEVRRVTLKDRSRCIGMIVGKEGVPVQASKLG